jgi:flagellin
MRINQNIMAFNAYRNLNTTADMLSSSLEKLSSGFRINRAADDAAGLVKSESLRAEIGGTNQAISNAQDGISFVQTAEGALNEVQAILQRVRDLAVSAANTATTDGSAQQAETNQLTAELNAIGTRTQFANKTVFTDYSASGAALAFQVGAGAGGANQLTLGQDLLLDTTTASGLFTVVLASIDLTTNAGATSAIALLDSAIADVSTARSTLGATQNRFEHIVANLSVAAENLTSSESRIRDTDMSLEMVNFTRDQIMNQAGTAMLAQANQVPQSVLKLLQ